jgi:hypothetical protein
MKTKWQTLVHSFLATFILLMAILVLGAMNETSAQTQAQNQNNQIQAPNTNPFKTFAQNFKLNYYLQVLGPSPALPADQTYNVFVESKSPLQTFHALSIVYKLPKDFALSASFAGIQHFSSSVDTPNGKVENDSLMFNPRLNLMLPAMKTNPINFYHTLSYEFAANNLSRDANMKRGYVFSQNMAFNLPYTSKFMAGFLTQAIRYEYEENTQVQCNGCTPVSLQTVIVSTGPYVNYRLSDKWLATSLLTFDWDQRGDQTGTTNFNNNLPNRWRLGVKYFPASSWVTHIGLFTQGLLKASDETTVLGGDFSFSI